MNTLCAINSLSCVASLEKENQVLKDQLEKINDSYTILELAYEVLVTSVKFIESHAQVISTSQVDANISFAKPCCSLVLQSCVENVLVDQSDNIIAQEQISEVIEDVNYNDKLIKLKGKSQVQPPHDNYDHMVKKVEKGSIATSRPANGLDDNSFNGLDFALGLFRLGATRADAKTN